MSLLPGEGSPFISSVLIHAGVLQLVTSWSENSSASKGGSQTAAPESSRGERCQEGKPVKSFCLPTSARVMRGKETEIEGRSLMGWKEDPI